MQAPRTILTALAALAFAAAPAVANATPAPADPYEGGPTDQPVLTANYPQAVLTVPPLVRVGTTVDIVLDASTGDVAEQELRVYEPDGTLYAYLRDTGPPNANTWVRLRTTEVGTYWATLTVTGPAPTGYTDSVTGYVSAFGRLGLPRPWPA